MYEICKLVQSHGAKKLFYDTGRPNCGLLKSRNKLPQDWICWSSGKWTYFLFFNSYFCIHWCSCMHARWFTQQQSCQWNLRRRCNNIYVQFSQTSSTMYNSSQYNSKHWSVNTHTAAFPNSGSAKHRSTARKLRNASGDCVNSWNRE